MKKILSMFFLTLSNVDIWFAEKKLLWRIYPSKKALPTTRQVELIKWKDFTKAMLNKNIKAFLVHVSFLVCE